MDVLSQGTDQTSGFFFFARNPTEASAPSHDEPTALPLLHSQEIAVRDYLLWGEPHLFFKWPYLSQIKETLGENWGGTVFVLFFFLLAFETFLWPSSSDLSL